MPQPRLLDTESLRTMLGPNGEWARAAGRRVRARREDLKWTVTVLAQLADTHKQVISQVECGAIVPREYLKVAIANALSLEVSAIWEPVRRSDLRDMKAMVA